MKDKERKQLALFVIGVVILLFFAMRNPDPSRTGFNDWYSQNTSLVIFGGISIILLMIFWAFHESKLEQDTKMRRAEARRLEALGKLK